MPRELDHLYRLEGHTWECTSVDFHPASNLLISGGFDRTIRVWDVDENAALRTIDRSCHSAPVTCVKWHPNGALFASTSADHTTCLWNASTGERMRLLREHFGWVLHCSFAPDRTKMATASWDKTVRLWDPNTGELLSTLRAHTKGVWSCAFYPVGHTSALLASGGEDATARLWDTRTRKVALTLSGGHADAIYSVAWSNDGTMLATGSADKTVTIWDPKAGKILRLLKAHDDTVKSAVFAPINQHNSANILATAGGFTAILWNPGLTSNNLLTESRMHNDGKEVEAVSISYDGKLLATGGRDGAVCVSKIPPFRNDAFEGIDPSARRQSRAAESWLRQGKSLTQRGITVPDIRSNTSDNNEQEARRAKTNDPLMAERRSKFQLERADQNKDTSGEDNKKLKQRSDPSKLLASRGFNREGLARVAEESNADISSANLVTETSNDAMSQEPFSSIKVESDAHPSVVNEDNDTTTTHQPLVQLRKTTMLDDKGKVHPMVAAVKRKQPQVSKAPPKADNVDSLMDMLQEKMESEQGQSRKMTSRPSSSVEELLDFSKPVLDRRPRVPTTSNIFRKESKDTNEHTVF